MAEEAFSKVQSIQLLKLTAQYIMTRMISIKHDNGLQEVKSTRVE